VGSWAFRSNHGRVLLFLARDPGMRLRDIAARAAITERSAYGIVTDLAEAGYVVKQKDRRRNRCQIQAHLPLPEPTGRERTVGEVLALFAAPPQAGRRRKGDATKPARAAARAAGSAQEACSAST
jgi:hypothetical protein